MTTEGRIPCINPRCRRTAPLAKFGEGVDIICGKCFRALPPVVKQEYRRCWREIRKWQRRIARSVDPLKAVRMKPLLARWEEAAERSWQAIHHAIVVPDKPAGLDAFLAEVGL